MFSFFPIFLMYVFFFLIFSTNILYNLFSLINYSLLQSLCESKHKEKIGTGIDPIQTLGPRDVFAEIGEAKMLLTLGMTALEQPKIIEIQRQLYFWQRYLSTFYFAQA